MPSTGEIGNAGAEGATTPETLRQKDRRAIVRSGERYGQCELVSPHFLLYPPMG